MFLGLAAYSASLASGAMYDTKICCLYAVLLPNDAQKYDATGDCARQAVHGRSFGFGR